MLFTSMLRVVLTRSFKPFVFKGGSRNGLEFQGLEDLGLYVHIPFCRSLCPFCPYCKVIHDKQKADAYKAALLKEIDLACGGMAGKKKATSLYFGGGTPALMIDDLKDIIDRLMGSFSLTGGIGVELHPDDITEEVLGKLKEAGVTMVSVGIQSFDEGCLRVLGRSGEDYGGKLRLVREHGFDVVDVDLIFAIPGQTEDILEKDIGTAFEQGATQVSAYPFIDFTFADNPAKPLSGRVKKRMLQSLAGYCRGIDADRTSVWTFAKPGTEKYSSVTRDTFLGFGVSATTLLRDSFKINTFSIGEYVKRVDAGVLPTSLTLRFTKRQRAVYHLFWSAYGMGIDGGKFEKVIGTPMEKMFGAELFLGRKLGFLKKEGNSYALTDKAAELYHSIEQAYTTAYIDKMWNVSRKQAFPDRIVLK
ncbi:coproporphyrinogen-III oxidase family protein [Anaerotalea alkaliphila]|uniref:Heme chaperone HemW n=1 Tax=Anaerotalea alkaliphila TaxID=2662126 RepID=A0A7X5HVJ6_9FIRM|nr:radical SAM protein [Anaerotalea alkaliphila]NDL67452.1 radical SAM protein [Anaerotalea alkaliphila]